MPGLRGTPVTALSSRLPRPPSEESRARSRRESSTGLRRSPTTTLERRHGRHALMALATAHLTRDKSRADAYTASQRPGLRGTPVITPVTALSSRLPRPPSEELRARSRRGSSTGLRRSPTTTLERRRGRHALMALASYARSPCAPSRRPSATRPLRAHQRLRASDGSSILS